ncbi:putative membrane protein [Acinetobacter sp. AR_0276]|nr:putative membrane protein [Acinetobacter sp. AR_0276]
MDFLNNITIIDVLVVVGFAIAYPLYWFLAHKLMNEIFGD